MSVGSMRKSSSSLTLAITVAICAFARPASPGEIGPRGPSEAVAPAAHPEPNASAPVARSAEEAPPPAAPVVIAPSRLLKEAVHAYGTGAVLYLPEGFHADRDGSFDLVVHFHGGAPIVEPSLVRAGLNAALVTVNLGIGSGVYQTTYQDPTRLEHTFAWANAIVEKRAGVAGAHVGRLALSAWSAGYGAVMTILPQQHSVGVDAVLLADGLHAGYLDARRHTIDPLRMGPFLRFAVEATSGTKLMGVTHSAIETYGYASTTETAAYLLAHTPTDPQAPAGEAQIPGDLPGLARTSNDDRGGLHVRGFEGVTKKDHCAHVWSLGETLFPLLGGFWSRGEKPSAAPVGPGSAAVSGAPSSSPASSG